MKPNGPIPNANVRLYRIMEAHRKGEGEGGMTDGYCIECEWMWPCPTYRMASGWVKDPAIAEWNPDDARLDAYLELEV